MPPTTPDPVPGDIAAALAYAEEHAFDRYVADDGVALLAVGDATSVVVHDAESTEYQPRRQRGLTVLHTPESLVDWVDLVRLPSTEPLVYADVDEQRLTAVINPGTGPSPAWGDHQGHMRLRPTPQWKEWASVDGKLLDQESFATHVQDRAADFIDPAAMDMREVAETLTLNVGATVASGVRLRDGARRIVFNETVDATAGAEREVEIPELITLRFPLFEGTEPVELTARFVYRRAEGRLKLAVQVVDRALVERAAVDQVVAKVADHGLTVLWGVAPPAVKPAPTFTAADR